jgi:glyoxylase-like metal-dependent hydrolase (beta-lactamase superfamily II)
MTTGFRVILRAFALFLVAALIGPVLAQSTPKYQIYAIEYAQLKQFPVSQLIAGADKSRKMDIAMMIWLIKGEGHIILFDCGFYREQFMTRWKPADYVSPADAVKRAGVQPEDVTDVIVSHIHWDHADGFDLFPKAKIWIQREELEYYAGQAWQTGKRTAADPDDIIGLVKLNTQGRVGLVQGDGQEILPGIKAYIGGKHTYQSQFITVNTGAATVVLASDNVYMYENLEKHVPIAATLDPASNLRAQDRMRQLASDPKLIIPGHDPAVMTNFPQTAPGVVQIQ